MIQDISPQRLINKHLSWWCDMWELWDNDVHCGFNDTIGYDGFTLYRKELQEKYKNVILVST